MRAAAARRSGPIVPDARLDRVAADLARVMPDGGLPPLELLTFLLRHYGLPEPEPHVMVIQGGSGAAGEGDIVTRVRERLPDIFSQGRWDRVAAGVTRDGPRASVVMLMQEVFVDLEPVPRQVRAGGTFRVNGRIRRGVRNPQVVVTPPRGGVREVRAAETRGRFETTVGCTEGNGEYQVEVVGQDASGPVVLANFPVWCGTRPPTRAPVAAAEPVDPQDPGEAERELFDLVNGARKQQGLPPLVSDRRLAAIARAHSREMASTGQVAHVSPRTGSAEDRLARAGLSPSLAAENVGRAATAAQAHRGFMGSPGHRGNVLDRQVTAVGIGVAEGPAHLGVGRLFFTQLFAAGL
jgi:uncharacterized protein YkwD